jgi:hypothetical protein
MKEKESEEKKRESKVEETELDWEGKRSRGKTRDQK